MKENYSEIVNSVKLEASGLRPSDQTMMEATLQSFTGLMEERFASFITDEGRQRAILVKDRIIESPVGDFSSLWWGRPNPHFNGFESNFPITGVYDETANMIVIPDFNGIRETLGPLEPMLREELINLYRTISLAHEFVHSYEDPRLPQDFAEIMTRYVSNILVKPIVGFSVAPAGTLTKADALIEKYGDEIFSVFFGTSKNPLRRFIIFHDSNSKLDETTEV